jgi:retinoid hydroxylase
MVPAYIAPGNFGLFFMGEIFLLYRDLHKFYWDKYRLHGSTFKIQLAGRKILVVSSPDSAQAILSTSSDCFSVAHGWDVLEPFFGKGILLRDGSDHSRYRKLLISTFHTYNQEQYISTIHETIAVFFDRNELNTNFLLFPKLRELSISVISEILFGKCSLDEIKELQNYFDSISESFLDVVKIPLPLSLYQTALHSSKSLQDFVKNKLNSILGGNSRESCLFRNLVQINQSQDKFSDSELIELCIHILFAGHETVAQFVFSALIVLSNNIEWYKIIETEININYVSETHYQGLIQSKIIKNFLKEVERMFPPTFVIPRGVIKDVTLSGYEVPAGWHVHLCPIITHRSTDLYERPNEFNPYRFEDSRSNNPYMLYGFGGGLHSCLGKEIALIETTLFLAELFHRFDWLILPAYSSFEIVNYNKIYNNFTLSFKKKTV